MFKKILLVLFLAVIGLNAQSYYDALPILDSATTADGDTLSGYINLKGNQLFTLKVPSTFDGTTITIYSSSDSTSGFEPAYSTEDNTVLSFTATAGRKYYFSPTSYFWINQFIKIESNSAATGADTWLIEKGKYFKK